MSKRRKGASKSKRKKYSKSKGPQKRRLSFKSKKEDILTWECDQCVTENPDSVQACQMCLAPRPKINEIDGSPDLSMLVNLEMETVLHNLEFRYSKMARKYPYTSVSTILLAINPYERLPIYGQDVINEFHEQMKKGSFAQSRPHPYGVASRSYMRMIQRKCNQSIVVCGESGSGKSETAKLVMRHLAMTAPSSTMESSIIEQQMIATAPVLEAYGHAKTILNNNSSRFAKFTKILYDVPEKAKEGYILGSYLDTYLLEKSRVIFQSNNERNYHIPYFLFQGLPQTSHEELGIMDPKKWWYTSQGNSVEVPGVSDIARFEELKECFVLMRMDEGIVNDLYSLTSGVFNLGNIASKRRDDGFSSLDPSTQSYAETVARLWGIEVKALNDRLTTASMKVMKKIIVKMIEHGSDERQYVACRDNVAKGLYENVFLYLCDRINAELYQTDEDDIKSILFVGVLDVFGFQNVLINSFEQFCMNFINEKLQQFFNYHIIRSEQEEYIKESVFWTPIAVPDNLTYINFVESKDTGFFTLLDSACKAPKPNVEAFMQLLFKKHQNTDCIRRVKDAPGGGKKGKRKKKSRSFQSAFDGFEITHFADRVTYDASQFLIKNMESMHPDTAKMLKKSTKVLVREIGGGYQAKGKKKKSASAVFLGGVKTLMRNLQATEPYFIICVNPNNRKSSTQWHKNVVQNQLRSSGVVEALKVLKLGYPTRVPYSTLYDRYHGSVTNPLIKNMGPEAFSLALLIAFDVNEHDYNAGLTKIFFKPSKAAVLDTIMARAGQPLSAEQNNKMTKWVVAKRIKQMMGICKAFLKIKKMVNASRSSAQIVGTVHKTLSAMVEASKDDPQMPGAVDKLNKHKDKIITYFLQNKIDLINFGFTEDEFCTELKQHCADELLHDALKILYAAIQEDVKALEQQIQEDAKASQEQIQQDDALDKDDGIDLDIKVSWEDKIVSECMQKIKGVRILPPGIPIDDTALAKQQSVFEKEKALLEKHVDKIQSSCVSIQKCVGNAPDPMLSDQNPFKLEDDKSGDDADLLHDVDKQSVDDEDASISKQMTKYEACRVRFEEELHAKTSAMHKTKSVLEMMENNTKKKKKCKCVAMKKITKSVAFTAQVASRALSLVDIVTDSFLLYSASRIPELWFLTLTLVLSISSSYIISYSSGVQLYLFRHTFDSLKGFKKLLMTFFILPTGILYFVFLDLADIYLRLFRWMYFVLCCKSIQEMQQYEQILAAQLGMDRMNWEGFKAQRSIGQLMFESIPQFIVQTIVFYVLDLDSILKSDDSDIASSNTISETQLQISIVSALINIIGTIVRLKIDSICCKTDLISYSLSCVKARVDWIPQLEHILEAIKNKTSTSIDYQMSYKIPCVPHTRHVEYDFSVTTINRLISELRAIDVSDYYISEHDDGKLLQIHFRDSLRLLPLQSTIELLAICQEKGVKVLSVASNKAKKKYDWFSAIKISKAQGQDVQLLEHSRDDEGLPYIMKLMKLTDIEERRSIFRDLIEHDFDLNIHDLVTNESIVFTLIRTYDYKNLKYLFEHYSSNKGVLLRVNYHNKDGMSPLGVALTLFQNEEYTRNKKGTPKKHQIPFIWEIMFLHGAKLSFPCKTNPDRSPLMFTLRHLRNKSLARSLMQKGAPLYGKETTSLNELFVNYELEDEEHWSEDHAHKAEEMKVETQQDMEMNTQEEKYQLQPLQDEIEIESNPQIDPSWVALLCDVVKHTGHSLKCVADGNGNTPLHYFIKHSNVKHIKRKHIQALKMKRLKHLISACKEWEKERNNDNDTPYQLILKQEDEYLFFALADFDKDFIRHIMSEKTSIQQLMEWIIHMLLRVTARYPKGLRRRNHRVNHDRDVQCLDQMFKRYSGTSDLKWPNKYTKTSSVDDKTFDLIDVCLDKSQVQVVTFLRKYWNFNVSTKQGETLNTIRRENAKKRAQDDEARFESILQKREIDPLFDYLDNHSQFKGTIMTNKQFVLQIIEWIIDITQNIAKKYADGITDDIRVSGDVDIQSLDRLFNTKYFGKRIQWPLSSEEDHEIELIDVCLEHKLYEVPMYLHEYWSISMNEEQKAKLEDIKPATPIEVEPDTDDTKEEKEKETVEEEVRKQLDKLSKLAKGTKTDTNESKEQDVELKEDYESDLDDSSDSSEEDDEEDAEQQLRSQLNRLKKMTKLRRKGTPPPVYNVENIALDEEDHHQGVMSVSNHANIDQYNKAKQFALSLSPFASLKYASATQSHVNNNVVTKKGESHKIEILYSFLVESLSVADLITDILVVKQLIEARQVWWISFMFLFMVSPYLVSHSTMCSLLSVRRSHYLPKQTKCPPIGLFTLNVLSLVLLTPFAIVWFSLVDAIFMLYLVISSLIFALSIGYCDVSNVMDDLLFQKILGMTKMEVIGYRRLRTLSQLLFETFPQILLQVRILIAIRYEGQDEFNITTDELWLSIIIAFVHVFLEVAIIYLDARASKMSLSHYAVACLAARLHWIPFLTQIADSQSRVSDAVFDFEVIQYKVWFFCNNTYRIKYEFTPSSFKKLSERIMKLPVIASLNAPSNHILSSVWTEYHVANTMPVIKLGKTCCRSLNLDLFPLFFRSVEKRVMIETSNMDWNRIIFKFKRSVYYSSDNKFLEVLLTEFLNFVEVELIIQLAIELRLSDVDIKCDILQQLSVSADILRVLKKYYDKGVYFGLNSKVIRTVYKLMDDNKWISIYETDTSYIHVIILMLWYTRRTVLRHQDPKANTRFIDHPKRHQLLQKISKSVLSKSFRIQYQTERSDEDEENAYDDAGDECKVPFEILECFKHFESQIESFLIKLTASVQSDCNRMYIKDKDSFEYFNKVFNAQCIEFLSLIINAPWNVIQQFPIHILCGQLFCKLDPIVLRLEMVHGFGHYLLSSAMYRETSTVSVTLEYVDHCEVLNINHCDDGFKPEEEEEEKHSISGHAGEIEMKTMMEKEILLQQPQQQMQPPQQPQQQQHVATATHSPPTPTANASNVMGISRIEIDFDGFECKNLGEEVASMGTIQLFTVLPSNTTVNDEWILNKIVLAEMSFERAISANKLIVDLYQNEVLGSIRSIYTAYDRIQLMPLKLSIKGRHDAINVRYNRIHVDITYLLRTFKDVSSLPFENLANKVYEVQNVALAQFVNKYKDEFESDHGMVSHSQNALHILCDLDDPKVEIFEMILKKATGHEMVNKVRFDGKTPLKVLQDNMRMDAFKKSEMLQRLLSHRNIQTVTKQKNVVIVGCKNSGKRTLLKQLQIYYKTNKRKRKAGYKLIIVKFIIKTVKRLIKHCGDPKIAKLENKDARKVGSIKINTIQNLTDLPVPYNELFASIQKLWNQRSIKRVYTDIGFMIDMSESVQYFLDFRLKMIQDASYVPSDLDVLMLPDRVSTTRAIQSMICTVNDEANNELQIRWIVHATNKILKLSSIYEGNNNSKEDEKDENKEEKDKEIALTSGIDTVIFVVSLTSFVEMNVLHKTDNNFLNGLKLYKRYCLDPKFNSAKFVVLLNKTDMFQRQLKNKNAMLLQLSQSMAGKSYDEWLDVMKGMFTAQYPSRTFFFYHESIASDPKSLSIIKELENVVLNASAIEGLPIKYHRIYTFLQQIGLESYYAKFVENGLTQMNLLGSITTDQLQNDIGILNLSHRLQLLKYIKLYTKNSRV